MNDFPQAVQIACPPPVTTALSRLAHLDNVVLFESIRRHDRLGRYSFLTASPIEISELQTAEFGVDPFQTARKWSEEYKAQTDPRLPPFQGGFAGLLSYELGACWEKLPKPLHDEFQWPACVIGFYDWVIAWDHLQNQCWIIAHGFPEQTSAARAAQASATIERVLELLTAPAISSGRSQPTENAREFEIETRFNHIPSSARLFSNFSKEGYQSAVDRIVEYIAAGDIFQANLAQRFVAQTEATALQIYSALRVYNPAPFAAYFQHLDWAVLSSSPERFIRIQGQRASTRPIKGTRQRRPLPEADLFARDELRESEKDRAENVMIVDLLRNDLSRVCLPGTICVPELCSIESYETVTHLVSEVTGELKPGMSFWDVLQATFPGGSITGTPKIRAMEIISELEQVARGPYCGSIFYLGFDGTADSNILIRTIAQKQNRLYFSVGGGIVAQSIPRLEYEETLHKATGLREALESIMDSD